MSISRLILPLVVAAAVCSGQGGRTEIRGDVGWTGFLDEGIDDHLLVGASVRAYLTQRVSFQPEFQYMKRQMAFSGHHYDLALLANFAYDFTAPGSRVVPYVTAGPGVIYTSQSRFSNTEFFLSGGGGAKIFFAERWYVAPEFRVGWEPHMRFSVGLGYVLRR